MATFNLCNQFDQLAEGKVVYYGTEHTEYADLEQPKEEKPKKKFSSGRLFGKFLGGLVAVVAVAAVVAVTVAYGVSVVATGGASLAALPAVAAAAGAIAGAFTAYEGGLMVEAQYQNDKANQEEGSWGDYIGGALINTANIGAQEAVLALAFPMAGNLAGRVVRGFAVKYGGKMFAKLGISKTIGKWFGRGMSEAATEATTKAGTKAATETVIEKQAQLLDELIQSGVKCTPENVVAIIKDSSGKLIWLETGNAKAGLEHIIMKHADDFARRGIALEEIKDVVMQAVEKNVVVGRQGRDRIIYEVVFKGETQRIAVTVSKNGYVVGANPASMH